jgi:hypothetical protein
MLCVADAVVARSYTVSLHRIALVLVAASVSSIDGLRL